MLSQRAAGSGLCKKKETCEEPETCYSGWVQATAEQHGIPNMLAGKVGAFFFCVQKVWAVSVFDFVGL